MPKAKSVPVPPVTPLSLACSFCHAKPNQDCLRPAGEFSELHIARIRAAAKMDTANKLQTTVPLIEQMG